MDALFVRRYVTVCVYVDRGGLLNDGVSGTLH